MQDGRDLLGTEKGINSFLLRHAWHFLLQRCRAFSAAFGLVHLLREFFHYFGNLHDYHHHSIDLAPDGSYRVNSAEVSGDYKLRVQYEKEKTYGCYKRYKSYAGYGKQIDVKIRAFRDASVMPAEHSATPLPHMAHRHLTPSSHQKSKLS